ncbi:MAG: Coenzyme F420 hydrogenase/dehydrogenase, beta subunit C-terminal domain [Candidatus Hodarchaeota archaeon]
MKNFIFDLKSKIDNTTPIKTFKDLEQEVILAEKCCACGACIAYCESQSFNVIEIDNYIPKFKSEKNADNCTECGVCYYICPQTFALSEKLGNFYFIDNEIGHILKILAAKTTNPAIEKVGQDGGIVSTLLAYLFERRKIDAAIVSEYNENFEPIPKIIFDKEDLLKSAGTRYYISSQILPLKDLYNISQEILEKKHIIDIDQIRIAFVGTPCQCRAISKMKLLHIKPAHVIKYNISLFCFENFNYNQLSNILKKEINVKSNDIQKTWIKKNFFVKTKNDKEFEVNIKTLDPAVRKHCKDCDEFTGKFSDISIGAAGAPKGYSMILIRTETVEKIINSMLSEGFIEQFIVPTNQSIEWKNKKLSWFKKLITLKLRS